MNTNPNSHITSLEICLEDRWLSLNSTLQINNEENGVIRNLKGTPTLSNFISLSWEALEAVARYEVICSSSQLTSTAQVAGTLDRTIVTVLPFSGYGDEDYRCCLTAYKNRTLFSLVEFTSTECVSVPLDRSSSDSVRGGQQLDPTVTYALGGLSGLLIIVIVLVAVGCFCVVISKRKDQITYPKEYVHYHNA